MGITHNDIYTYDTVTFSHIDHVCQPDVYTTGTNLVKASINDKRDVEHRIKPADLRFNQTSQPYVRTFNSDRGYVRYNAGNTCDWACGYCRLSPTYYYYSSGPRMEAPVGSTTVSYPSDWATQLRLQIKDTSVSLGQSLVEYRQSARMFGSAATAAANAWRAFRKKRPLGRVTMCDIPAAHLVYTYGVAPLMSDVYDSVEILRLKLDFPPVAKYYVKQEASKVSTISSPGTQGTVTKVHFQKSQRATAYVEFDMSKNNHFLMGNPAELAWELIPYSFVVDWFFSVGDFLQALDALSNTSRIGCSVVEKTETNVRDVCFAKDVNGVYQYGYGSKGRPGTFKQSSHQRTAYSTIPFPAYPQWQPSTSYKKITNAVMLLWQAVASRRGSCSRPKPRFLTPVSNKRWKPDIDI